jgi:hypothetical protein
MREYLLNSSRISDFSNDPLHSSASLTLRYINSKYTLKAQSSVNDAKRSCSDCVAREVLP